MHVLGLTGGIASGKSTVSGMLQDAGAIVLDADIIARAVVMPASAGFQAVVAYFGPGLVTAAGTLDRALLGRIVFADPQKRKHLEAIVHPLVFAALTDQLSALRKIPNVKLVVLSIPLLYETPFALPLCNSTVVVWAPEEIQLRRLMRRDNLSQPAAMQRIGAQLPLVQKCRLAQYCIDNSGAIVDTRRQLQQLLTHLL